VVWKKNNKKVKVAKKTWTFSLFNSMLTGMQGISKGNICRRQCKSSDEGMDAIQDDTKLEQPIISAGTSLTDDSDNIR
jgi:hypothetical protein